MKKRQFSRIPFDVHAHVNDQQGGLLIEKPADWTGQIGMSYDIGLILDDAQIVIKVSSTIAHIDGQRVGFESQQLDLDSMMHLKRSILLNLGDESLLHRELSTLTAQ